MRRNFLPHILSQQKRRAQILSFLLLKKITRCLTKSKEIFYTKLKKLSELVKNPCVIDNLNHLHRQLKSIQYKQTGIQDGNLPIKIANNPRTN